MFVEDISQTKELAALGDATDNFPRFSIDWQEEYVRLSVNGVEKRRLNQTDIELDAVSCAPLLRPTPTHSLRPCGEYPTTPARV